MPEPCITEIRGEIFPSQAAVARYFRIHPTTVHHAIERGQTDGLGLGANHDTRKPVWMDGARYDSYSALSEAKDIPKSTVHMSINRAKKRGMLMARTKWGVLTW